MAKKDFKNLINEDNKVNKTTQSFFSEETLKKADKKKEELIEPKQRKAYTKFNSKKNKTHLIGIRITDEQYEELLKQVDKTKSGTISNYIVALLERGL